MRLLRGLDRVGGDLDVAIGTVLEAHRARQARCELAVNLAFGRAGADRAPGDEVGDVLRRDHVEVFAAGGHSGGVDLEQQFARDSQTVVDAEAAVHVRIVDQPFPTDGGAGLLEIHAHDDFEIGRMVVTLGFELARIVERRGRIVDRARADDDDQSVVHAMQDAVNSLARLMHRDRGAVFARKLADQVRRGRRVP